MTPNFAKFEIQGKLIQIQKHANSYNYNLSRRGVHILVECLEFNSFNEDHIVSHLIKLSHPCLILPFSVGNTLKVNGEILVGAIDEYGDYLYECYATQITKIS